MTILTLKFKEKNIREYALLRGQHLTVGRSQDNDIVIDNPAVSGYHARVESVASSFILRDLDSTNGIFVNKKRIQGQYALQHNDIVLIGKHELVYDRMVFDRSARVDRSASAHKEFSEDKTMFLDTRAHRELMQNAVDAKVPESSTLADQSKSGGKRGFFPKLWQKIFSSICP